MSKGVDFTASYTLASAKSTIGSSVDQLNVANIQNPDDPFDAPVRTVRPPTPTRGTASASRRPSSCRGVPRLADLPVPAALVSLVDGRDITWTAMRRSGQGLRGDVQRRPA
jgi:hypothetical protein